MRGNGAMRERQRPVTSDQEARGGKWRRGRQGAVAEILRRAKAERLRMTSLNLVAQRQREEKSRSLTRKKRWFGMTSCGGGAREEIGSKRVKECKSLREIW